MIKIYLHHTPLSPSKSRIASHIFTIFITGLSMFLMNDARGQINATFVGQAPTCPQGSDGNLCCINITGGTPPYFCSITFPVGVYSYDSLTNCFYSLSSGPYTIAISDNYGNTGAVNTIIPPSTMPPIQGEATILSPSNNEDNGSICMDVTGGYGSFNYLWFDVDGGTEIGDSICIDSIGEGNYNFAAIDLQTGCTTNFLIQVNDIAIDHSVVITPSQDSLLGCSGAINLTVEGSGPFSFCWSGTNDYSSFDEDIDGLCPGEYTVIITDANGSIIADSFIVDLAGLGTKINSTQISFNAWPNPFRSQLKAQLPANTKRVDWLDATGRLVHSEKVYYPYQEWNLSNLPIGVYHMQVVLNDGRVLSKKVVKE
jgi:hypothetical protein